MTAVLRTSQNRSRSSQPSSRALIGDLRERPSLASPQAAIAGACLCVLAQAHGVAAAPWTTRDCLPLTFSLNDDVQNGVNAVD